MEVRLATFPENFPRKKNQIIQQYFTGSKNKVNSTIVNNFYIYKINANWSNSHKKLDLDSSLQKTKFKKIFLIPYLTLDGLFNDATDNFPRWIYRSIPNDWKKQFENIAPPSSRGFRKNNSG